MSTIYPLNDVITPGVAIGTGSGYGISAGDYIYIAKNIQVASLDATAINYGLNGSNDDGNVDVFVAGQVFGGVSGITIRKTNLNGFDTDQTIVIADTGMVTSNTGSAIVAGMTSLTGNGYVSITNRGQVSSNAHLAPTVAIAGTISSELINTGTLENTNYHGGSAIAVSKGATITNSGLISGKGIDAADATIVANGNFFGSSGNANPVTLNNSGTILALDTAYNSIGNALTFVIDQIYNTGTIYGKISLGRGDDLYDARGGGKSVGVIDAGIGNDLLLGGKYDEEFLGGAGGDYIDGGAGRDTVYYTSSAESVDIDLRSGAVTGGEAQGDTLVSIENIDGSDHNDRIAGNADENILKGEAGDDVLFGYENADILVGGDGDDFLDGGSGLDRLYGNAGADAFVFGHGSNLNIVYDFDHATDKIVLQGLTSAELSVGIYNFSDLELTTSGGDRMILRNVAFDDFLNIEFESTETVIGYGFFGDGTDNTFHGSTNNDLFKGGLGTDRFYGEGGNDIFEIEPGGGLDIVYDFVDGSDKILYVGGTFADLIITVYSGDDADIRTPGSGRMVLRDVDVANLTADDFIFVEPEGYTAL